MSEQQTTPKKKCLSYFSFLCIFGSGGSCFNCIVKFFANPKNKEAIAKVEEIAEEIVETVSPQLKVELEIVEAAIDIIKDFATKYEFKQQEEQHNASVVTETAHPKAADTSLLVSTNAADTSLPVSTNAA
jgi:hypothetical protein